MKISPSQISQAPIAKAEQQGDQAAHDEGAPGGVRGREDAADVVGDGHQARGYGSLTRVPGKET